MRTILTTLASVLLTGCFATTPPPPPLTKTVYRVIDITPALTAPVRVPMPPSRDEFRFADAPDVKTAMERRVSLLLSRNHELYGSLDMCNKRLFEIDQMQVKIKKQVEELNAKESK